MKPEKKAEQIIQKFKYEDKKRVVVNIAVARESVYTALREQARQIFKELESEFSNDYAGIGDKEEYLDTAQYHTIQVLKKKWLKG